jgi:hypothetical protein
MSNQQNNDIQLDDNIQGSEQPQKPRSKNFYRKRPERENQDLGEDQTQALNDDGQRSNNSNENNNPTNDDNNVNNTRGISITVFN